MFMEAVRRQDLIRFGKWGDEWDFKPASDASCSPDMMPIPTPQLDANIKASSKILGTRNSNAYHRIH